MKTDVQFENFFTATGGQDISKIIVQLSDKIELQLNIVPLQDDSSIKALQVIMIDKIGVSTLSATLDKSQFRELIEIFKKGYDELNK